MRKAQLEREVRGILSDTRRARRPTRVPLYVSRSEVQRQLLEIERRGGSSRLTPSRTWRFGSKFTSYDQAEPWQVIQKIGAKDAAHVLIQPDPVGYARWRADGWRRGKGDHETASAYDRLSELAADSFLY